MAKRTLVVKVDLLLQQRARLSWARSTTVKKFCKSFFMRSDRAAETTSHSRISCRPWAPTRLIWLPGAKTYQKRSTSTWASSCSCRSASKLRCPCTSVSTVVTRTRSTDLPRSRAARISTLSIALVESNRSRKCHSMELAIHFLRPKRSKWNLKTTLVAVSDLMLL